MFDQRQKSRSGFGKELVNCPVNLSTLQAVLVAYRQVDDYEEMNKLVLNGK